MLYSLGANTETLSHWPQHPTHKFACQTCTLNSILPRTWLQDSGVERMAPVTGQEWGGNKVGALGRWDVVGGEKGSEQRHAPVIVRLNTHSETKLLRISRWQPPGIKTQEQDTFFWGIVLLSPIPPRCWPYIQIVWWCQNLGHVWLSNPCFGHGITLPSKASERMPLVSREKSEDEKKEHASKDKPRLQFPSPITHLYSPFC